jgi:hypothetical protein
MQGSSALRAEKMARVSIHRQCCIKRRTGILTNTTDISMGISEESMLQESHGAHGTRSGAFATTAPK